ncbi:MAG: hypothetical protein AAF517_11515 [Planctomycetota bacterium]
MIRRLARLSLVGYLQLAMIPLPFVALAAVAWRGTLPIEWIPVLIGFLWTAGFLFPEAASDMSDSKLATRGVRWGCFAMSLLHFFVTVVLSSQR